MTLEEWLEAHNISLTDFEGMSGVPYQRISEHIRLRRPLSEKHVVMILRATKGKVSPATLRPSLKPIFDHISDKRRALVRRMTWFTFSLAFIFGVFAIIIFQGPTEFSESVIAESQQHYEEAQKALSEGDMDLALSHLEAIEKWTPAWYESRELHWQVRAELDTYAQKEQE